MVLNMVAGVYYILVLRYGCHVVLWLLGGYYGFLGDFVVNYFQEISL